jgi:hypothetical protein
MGLGSLLFMPDRIRKAATARGTITLFRLHGALKARQ